MLSGNVPVSYDIGAFVNVNVNVLPLVEQAIAPNNLWFFIMSFYYEWQMYDFFIY